MYIWNNPIEGDNVPERFGTIAEQIHFITNAAYTSKWNLIVYNKSTGSTLNKFIMRRFAIKENSDNTKQSLTSQVNTAKPMLSSSAITHTTPFSGILPLPNKSVKVINKKTLKPSNIKKSYTQTSKAIISMNIEDVLCIKDAFLSLSAKEVGKIIKVKNSCEGQKKPKVNMTTRGPSRKQIIIPIAKSNAELTINKTSFYISDINKCLRNIKSDHCHQLYLYY